MGYNIRYLTNDCIFFFWIIIALCILLFALILLFCSYQLLHIYFTFCKDRFLGFLKILSVIELKKEKNNTQISIFVRWTKNGVLGIDLPTDDALFFIWTILGVPLILSPYFCFPVNSEHSIRITMPVNKKMYKFNNGR